MYFIETEDLHKVNLWNECYKLVLNWDKTFIIYWIKLFSCYKLRPVLQYDC